MECEQTSTDDAPDSDSQNCAAILWRKITDQVFLIKIWVHIDGSAKVHQFFTLSIFSGSNSSMLLEIIWRPNTNWVPTFKNKIMAEGCVETDLTETTGIESRLFRFLGFAFCLTDHTWIQKQHVLTHNHTHWILCTLLWTVQDLLSGPGSWDGREITTCCSLAELNAS